MAVVLGSSASERTRRPVSMPPPAATTASAIASVIRALPPWISGQPTPCASAISIRPMPPVGTAVSGSIEWAAAPPMIARASGWCQRRASTAAGSTPRLPYPAMTSGWAGGRRSGWSSSAQMSSTWRAIGAIRRR
jgi:hypothetical protein